MTRILLEVGGILLGLFEFDQGDCPGSLGKSGLCVNSASGNNYVICYLKRVFSYSRQWKPTEITAGENYSRKSNRE